MVRSRSRSSTGLRTLRWTIGPMRRARMLLAPVLRPSRRRHQRSRQGQAARHRAETDFSYDVLAHHLGNAIERLGVPATS